MVGSGGRRRRHRIAAAAVGLASAAVLAGGCGSSLFATTTGTVTPPPTASSTTTSTAPAVNGVAVGVPVAGCGAAPAGTGTASPGGNQFGGSGGTASSGGWRPSFVLAPVPTALVGQVEFYSDGVHTVLAPTGWTCSTLAPSRGATELVVYPAGDPDPPTSGTPAPGTQEVLALFDSTGEPQGVAVVCPFFPVPTWQQREALCQSGHVPSGEQTSMPTPDVASVSDPAGVTGTLAGSGGPHAVAGVVIFPQVSPDVEDGEPVQIAEESCSLTNTALCPTILSDFEVREFPVPTRSNG